MPAFYHFDRTGCPDRLLPFSSVLSEIPDFQAYSGSGAPHFANEAELECAKIFDYYRIPWAYEPRTFVLEEDDDGRVVEPYARLLPPGAGSLHRGNGDEAVARHPQEPEAAEGARALSGVRVKLFYKRDIERLAQRYRLDLAS